VFADGARRHGRLFAVNDRADVAYAVRPDVLHLGQDDLPVPVAREILGGEIIIGRSTHARAEVAEAAAQPGSDYFCVGPTWPTPTKPGRPAPGPELLSYAAGLGSTKPWFAIGGIDASTLDTVLRAGATRVVVARAINDADDPGAAALELARRLRA
jgi:thiamine-phosphate pyrophosphorylase